MTSRYDESNGHVKLFFNEGEIDFVASPLLTSPGFADATVAGHHVRLGENSWAQGQPCVEP